MFMTYFRYILVASFICGVNRSTQRKPLTCHKLLATFVGFYIYTTEDTNILPYILYFSIQLDAYEMINYKVKTRSNPNWKETIFNNEP